MGVVLKALDVGRRRVVALKALALPLAASGTDLQTFLKTLNPAWNLVGRVHFNLAENRRDPEFPFAFMATRPTTRTRAMTVRIA